MRNVIAAVFILFVSSLCLHAQPDRSDVRRGNRDFRKEAWKEAEIDYRKALVKDSTSFAAGFNLANTLYRMGDMEQARKSYDALKDSAPASAHESDWYYNSGNAASQAKDWQAAVDAYRQSLLLNPGDIDAKENYIYARQMLEEQQNQQQDQQNQQDKQNNDNNDDGQDKDDGENDRQDSDQDKDDQGQQPPQEQPQSQGQQPKITPQAAQQMLQAIQAKEKETQEKVNKEKAEAMKSRQKEKNW